MAYRNIMIESPARLSVKNAQLLVKTDIEHTVPIEDIACLLIENRQVTITTAVLSELACAGCAVFVCDDRHIPCAVLEPYLRHVRMAGMVRLQMETGAVLKKQLWQRVVEYKIRNQALCLRSCNKIAEADALDALAGTVRSGDSDNREAAAAVRYFPALFEKDFARSEDSYANAVLNYGYAILRGAMARQLCVHGLLPVLGIFHRSDNFSLADDLMEPFRPVVDQLAYVLYTQYMLKEDEFGGTPTLTSNDKRLLFNCLNLDIISGEQTHTVMYAMERLVHSYVRSLENGKPKLLLPTMLPPRQHTYE